MVLAQPASVTRRVHPYRADRNPLEIPRVGRLSDEISLRSWDALLPSLDQL